MGFCGGVKEERMKIPQELEHLSKRDLIRYILILRETFEKRIAELEKRLLVYENAHTPPSQDKKKYPKREPSGQSVGAQKGHEGTTRETPEPNNFKELSLSSCPDCGKQLGRPRSVHKKTIIDLPEPQPLKITEYTIPIYFCNHCNQQVLPVDKGLPSEGIFGPNIMAEIALLKNEDRLPYNKIVNILNRQYGLDITTATALDINRRVADKLQGTYSSIKNEVMNSLQSNADETGLKVRGKKFWAWVFITLTSVLFMIRPSRGQKPIIEALGNNYKGKLGCDGWTSYPKCVKIIQRCWAHLLREAKWLAEKHDGQAKILHGDLCEMFNFINHIAIDTAKNTRAKIYELCIKEMSSIIERCKAHLELNKFAHKIENGLSYWFTCVLHPEIEPTNNKAERALREIVVQRKISSLWNEKGIKIKETIMSCIATWKLRRLNIFSMLRQTLSS